MNGKWTKIGCVLLVVSMTIGCLGDSDHREVAQTISESTEGAVDAMVGAMALLESSQMVGDYAAVSDCGAYGDVDCASYYAPDSGELEAGYEEMTDWMADHIFTSDNVESSSSGDVTYLLRGDVVCDPDLFFDDAGYNHCVSEVDALEIRLHAVMNGDDRLSLDILLGPDEIHPLSFTFSPEEVSATTILENVEPAVNHVADTFGEEPGTFPERLEGVVELGYYLDGDVAKFALHIHEDLGIEVDGYEAFELDVEAAGEVLAFGVDMAAETLFGAASLGEFALHFETYDSYGGTEPETVGVELAGLTSEVSFDPGSEYVEWTGVGLGDGPAVISINGEEVIYIDLNSGIGGFFDAVLQLQDDDLKFSVEPGIELEIGTFFHRVADTYDGFDDWAYDEVLSFVLGGDDNPAILFAEHGVEVLRGHLSLQSEDTDLGVDADAGMCIDDGGDATDWSHPFEHLVAEQCMGG